VLLTLACDAIASTARCSCIQQHDLMVSLQVALGLLLLLVLGELYGVWTVLDVVLGG